MAEPPTTSSQDRLGDIIAGHRLGRDALVLLGWSAEEIPAQGVALLKKRQQIKGRFSAATWFDPGRGRRWFLLIIHAPDVGSSQTGDGFQLHGVGAKASTIAYVPPSILGAGEFAGELLNCLGSRASDAVRFLMEICPAMSGAAAEPVRALISSALRAAAEESGVVEILGRADGESLLLQGWIRDPRKVEPRLLIDNGTLQEHGAVFGTFNRSDMTAPAQGFIALVRLQEHGPVAPPRQVYLSSEDRYYRLTVLPNAVHLRDEDVPQHLSGLMASLRADAASQTVFRAACRPRFTGQDTISGLNHPVRMAIDLTARIPGAGWYVTGWLLDPTKLVSAVLLRGAGGLSERLDMTWTRLARGDVRDGFQSDPLFAGRLSDDMHGFTVFIPASTDEKSPWIELDLGGRGTAFMPVAVTTVDGVEGRKRLLCSVDLHKAAASDIIERHLGPLFHAQGAAAKRRKAHRLMRTGTRGGRMALIVPVVDAATKINVVVAHLASCSLPDEGRVVFVCSPDASEAIRRLGRDLDFYGLDADVLVTTEAVDHCEALEIGVDAIDCPIIAFLSPRVHALGRDWLVALLAALGDGTASHVVSPTLLYEDGSVRYAGIDSVQFSNGAPYGAAVCSRAGYPRDALPRGEGARTLAGAIECCVMTRTAFDSVGGFSTAYALDSFKGIDLFLRMGAAGVGLSWTAATELYALDDLQGNAQHWAVVGGMVDGWSFRAGWRNRLSARQEPAKDVEADDSVIPLQTAARGRLRATAAE